MVICVLLLYYYIILYYLISSSHVNFKFSFYIVKYTYKEMKNIECLTLIEAETKTNDVAGINKNPDVKCLCLPFIVCFILITWLDFILVQVYIRIREGFIYNLQQTAKIFWTPPHPLWTQVSLKISRCLQWISSFWTPNQA